MRQYVDLIDYADSFPYACPHCGQVVRRRKGGACTFCMKPIESFTFGNGKKKHRMWVSRRGHAMEIVDHVLSKIREARADQTFVFTDEKLQIGLAVTFLKKCAGEADVAYHVVEAYFNPAIARAYNIWPSGKDICSIGQIIMKAGRFDNALNYAVRQANAYRAEPVEEEERASFFVKPTEPSYAGAE